MSKLATRDDVLDRDLHLGLQQSHSDDHLDSSAFAERVFSRHRADRSRQPSRKPWLAAALVLLGTGVTVSTAIELGGETPDGRAVGHRAQQDPSTVSSELLRVYVVAQEHNVIGQPRDPAKANSALRFGDRQLRWTVASATDLKDLNAVTKVVGREQSQFLAPRQAAGGDATPMSVRVTPGVGARWDDVIRTVDALVVSGELRVDIECVAGVPMVPMFVAPRHLGGEIVVPRMAIAVPDEGGAESVLDLQQDGRALLDGKAIPGFEIGIDMSQRRTQLVRALEHGTAGSKPKPKPKPKSKPGKPTKSTGDEPRAEALDKAGGKARMERKPSVLLRVDKWTPWSPHVRMAIEACNQAGFQLIYLGVAKVDGESEVK